MSSRFHDFLDKVEKEATFFRIHVVAFTFIPLIFSGIFYASNGRFPVSYLDSLFLCYSAMTVTGLSVVNLSTITAWQQVILYVLMMMGDITMVSWMMVLVRKHYFRVKCEYVTSIERAKKRPKRRPTMFLTRTKTMFKNAISSPVGSRPMYDPAPNQPSEKNGHAEPSENRHSDADGRFLDEVRTFTSSPRGDSASLPPLSPVSSRQPGVQFAMTSSMTPSAVRQRRLDTIREGVPLPRRTLTILSQNAGVGAPLASAGTGRSVGVVDARYKDHGGFPGPVTLTKAGLRRIMPGTYRKLERKMTVPYTMSYNNQVPQSDVRSVTGSLVQEERMFPRWLPAISGLTINRNSDFRTETLSDDELEKIGGTEYRALRLLSYVIPIYFVGTQLFSFILFAPWLSAVSTYDDVFAAQPRNVQKPWFSLFQVMGAYTGGGLSLVDQGMVPFQGAYLMIFAMMFVILAGNHALPIFLRLIVWIGTKVSTDESETKKAFYFLLDHPRRCFLYLFPSHQTWFLVLCLVGFSAIEWVAFEVLNTGLDVYKSLTIGPRTVAGLFQSLAVRASGFSIVPIASLAPALQFLYLVMMYIAVYPVAMSIRATNVYEERSLGVFEAPPDEEDEEPTDLNTYAPRERVGKYLGWHVRRQMSVDLWWLVWAVFLIAIIERDSLLDDSKKWFDMFRVLFELVSAFGGIGLSLGFPSDNYSFVGTLRPLSKLVVIVIMVRGRHRGLPVAVDRAVLLPSELVTQHAGDKPPDEKAVIGGELAAPAPETIDIHVENGHELPV